MRLNILDQMPIPMNQTAEEMATQTTQLVQKAEQWGYERYWFAEHHGTKGLISSSPELWMASMAAKTSTIKLGSGGILLPQYSSYKVASQLNQLAVAFPGRIDGGLGRSPGGTEKIRKALANDKENEMNQFWNKVDDIINWTTFHSYKGITASPFPHSPADLFVLGLGERSANEAAERGLGFVHGYFIQPARFKEAHFSYQKAFNPHFLKAPEAITAVFVVCGETDSHAEQLAESQDLWLLQTEKGLDSRIPVNLPQRLTEKEKERIQENRKRMIIGSLSTVKEKLDRLSEEVHSDQFLVLSNLYDFNERVRSYERLAKLISS